ncbi:MAG: gfo/Idh/MocA family oxidoreductase, partial [Candidatus Hydrogenedentes bacterium]|nr:gfo/Idh/MocA family oxidoreductase [Candidatus Hydrogenedentota bacterium]
MTFPSRRTFLRNVALGAGGLGLMAAAEEKPIAGFEETESTTQKDKVWQPISDRKIRMGLVGYGVCKFGAAFGFQDHPNVELIAVSDLIPERCAEMAKVCRC